MTKYVIEVPENTPATDKALLDEVIGCLTGFVADGDPKHLRIAHKHLECLLILASIDWSTGMREVDDGLTWDGEEPVFL